MEGLYADLLFKSLKVEDLQKSFLQKYDQLIGLTFDISLEFYDRTSKSQDMKGLVISKRKDLQ
jgi:hypothetical protein